MDGTGFGRYTLHSELGRGGMGTVYLAFDTHRRHDIALKVLPRALLHEPGFRERFEREARTIISLEHYAIVPVYDFGEHDGQPFIAMRLMRGGTLNERLARGALPLPECGAIMTRIGSALDRAHQRGIIHRDLKPGNILFDEDGQAYLADFGIARMAEGTTTMTVIGTPQYMAPEQAQGQPVDARTDVYQLGVVLFQAVTGSVPFEAPTPTALLFKHVYEPVPPLARFRPDLPPALQAVMEQALAKNPAHRFQSTGALATALTAVTGGSGVVPLPTPLPEPPPATTPTAAIRPNPPHRRWLPALGAVLALVVLGVVLNRVFGRNPTPVSTPPPLPTVAEALVIPTLPVTSPAATQPTDPSTVATDAPEATPTATPAPAGPTPVVQLVSGDAVAFRFGQPPVVDGDLGDWPAMPTFTSPHVVYSPVAWGGAADLSATWRLAWDANALYVGVAVVDDAHVQTQSGNQTWRGDSVDLQIDGNRANNQPDVLNSDNFQIVLSPGDFAGLPAAAWRFQANSSGRIGDAPGHAIVVAARPAGTGYTLEAAIPWADIGITPAAGLTLGVALNVSDNDTPGTATQEKMVSNSAGRQLTDPGSWGTLVLQ